MSWNSRTSHIATLTLIVVCSLAATDSNAQFGGRGSRGGNRDQSTGQSNRNVPQPRPDYESYEQIEYRLSLLEDDLRLQPGQRGPWDAFAAKERAYASDSARARARGATAAATAGGDLRHIDLATDAARNRVTALEDIAAASKALYAGLNPNQVTLADLRIPTIVAPQPRPAASSSAGYNLPDLGSSSRTPP